VNHNASNVISVDRDQMHVFFFLMQSASVCTRSATNNIFHSIQFQTGSRVKSIQPSVGQHVHTFLMDIDGADGILNESIIAVVPADEAPTAIPSNTSIPPVREATRRPTEIRADLDSERAILRSFEISSWSLDSWKRHEST
jgi:hypothetical protein